MGKHVCPVCEDVYAVRALVQVALGQALVGSEGWGCPNCGYSFLAIPDFERILRSAATNPSSTGPKISFEFESEPAVVWRAAASVRATSSDELLAEPGPPPYRKLVITKGSGERGVLLYDEEDAELVESHSWYLEIDKGGRMYATTTKTVNGKKHFFRAGKLILGPGPWRHGRVHYLNGDTLDCRRGNLQHGNQTQVLAKRSRALCSSQYRGVTWVEARKKWVAQFRGKNLGRYDDEVEAAKVFDAAAWEYWRDASYLNFPEEVPQD